jgi:hypothetical protein
MRVFSLLREDHDGSAASEEKMVQVSNMLVSADTCFSRVRSILV